MPINLTHSKEDTRGGSNDGGLTKPDDGEVAINTMTESEVCHSHNFSSQTPWDPRDPTRQLDITPGLEADDLAV